MATLHIEHAITDFATWTSAFDRFAEARQRAGVRAQRVLRPVDDRSYVMIQLDFDGSDAARAFLDFLTTQVWSTPERSPGLAGAPRTMILNAAPAAGLAMPGSR